MILWLICRIEDKQEPAKLHTVALTIETLSGLLSRRRKHNGYLQSRDNDDSISNHFNGIKETIQKVYSRTLVNPKFTFRVLDLQ